MIGNGERRIHKEKVFSFFSIKEKVSQGDIFGIESLGHFFSFLFFFFLFKGNGFGFFSVEVQAIDLNW